MNRSNNLYVIGIALVATLGGLLFGYDTAVISGTVKSLAHVFDISGFLLGATVSSALIGCIIGGIISGWFANYFGRRNSLKIAAVLFFVSAYLSGNPEFLFFAKGESSTALLVAFNIYRILGGIGVGLASAVCPMYIAEIAPAHMRGRMVSFNQFAIIFGMLVVYFVNYFIAYGQPDAWIFETGWRHMFWSEMFPAAAFFFLLFLVPKTPRFLVMSGNPAEAERVLIKIEGIEKAKKTLNEIIESLKQKTEKVTAFGWTVLLVGVLLSVFQQAVGINVVLYYAPRIFENLGFGSDAAMVQTVIMGFVNIIFTVVAILTVDKWGRKPLLITGSVGMAIGMFAIGTMAYFNIIGIATLIFIVIYTASFMMSWGPICWVLISEIFPNTIRGKAIAIAVAAQWTANFLVSSTFPALESFSMTFTYCLYGVMSVISIFFVWKMVPETKGKTLEEMSKLWRK
ncbi:MAG: D-xylose transporter XylE [Bacteroidales bacterium]|nr:D-xylose transporter XylE [Bacteroidales bacterium]